MSTYLLLITRIALSFIRFGYITLLALFISEDNLASIFFISYLITFLAIIIPIEYHYAVLRGCNFTNNGLNDESIPLFKHHLKAVNFLNYVFIAFAVISLIIFDSISSIIQENNDVTLLNIILLLVVVFFETKNNELYRYFQVSRIDLQIFNLLIRNLLPVIFHLLIVIFIKDINVITSYLCLIIFFNIIASFLRNIYLKESFFKLDLLPSLPTVDNIKFLKFSFPIVLIATFYMQLDKITLAYLLPGKDFIFYGFYSNLSNFIIVFTQITVIQPQLKNWYGNNHIDFDYIALFKRVFFVFLFACVLLFSAIFLSMYLPEVYKIRINASYIFLGYFLYSVSNILTVMLYVSKRDFLLLILEFLSVLFGILTFAFLFYAQLISVEIFPLVLGTYLVAIKSYPFITLKKNI
mgnify:CR=1 FL=1